MDRRVHDIYDIILKIIAITYEEEFLRYVGVESDIEKVLNIEMVTSSGRKLYLDYLCQLKNGKLCNIEFQYPKAKGNDLDRFFNYNITAETKYQKLTESVIFNFTSKTTPEMTRKIGKSKSYHPKQFYLGDVDFKTYANSIKEKCKSNEKLTSFEEITLLLMCLTPKCENKPETLKKIVKLMNNDDLFDENSLK